MRIATIAAFAILVTGSVSAEQWPGNYARKCLQPDGRIIYTERDCTDIGTPVPQGGGSFSITTKAWHDRPGVTAVTKAMPAGVGWTEVKQVE